MKTETSTYMVTKANGQIVVVDAFTTYGAMNEVSKVMESEGEQVERFRGSVKVSNKKAQEALANGARDLRKPVVATVQNRQRLGALVGM